MKLVPTALMHSPFPAYSWPTARTRALAPARVAEYVDTRGSGRAAVALV